MLRPGLIAESDQDMLRVRLDKIEDTQKRILTYLSEQQQRLAYGHDLLAQVINEHPEMVLLAMFQTNVSTGQTDVELNTGTSDRGFIVSEAGSITALAIRSNDARTAGSLTVTVTINGTGTGFSVTLDGTDTTTANALQDQGLDTFSAADRISADITSTGAWAPTTADIDIGIGLVLARGVR